jgi:hypothetical protein
MGIHGNFAGATDAKFELRQKVVFCDSTSLHDLDERVVHMDTLTMTQAAMEFRITTMPINCHTIGERAADSKAPSTLQDCTTESITPALGKRCRR